MIAGEFAPSLLVAVLIAKLLMTALCIGFGLFGGVFSPSLFIGVGGALAGQLLTCLALPISPALSVLPAVVSSAVIGAPITAVIIILELTQSYTYAVAVMVSVMLCSLITHRLFGHSFLIGNYWIGICSRVVRLSPCQFTVAAFSSQNYVSQGQRLQNKASASS